ncbi:MAG TPA: hypothetical protein VHA80_03420 [Solirubrobacterales bacterium]|nr:hypothetical protein [Solirubrobacterales bacterium]
MDERRRRSNRLPCLALAAILAATIVAALAGCGGDARSSASSVAGSALAAGHQARVPQRVGAVGLARRFARAYAEGVYRARPPQVRGETGSVRAALRAGASRVPTARRGLRSRLLGLELSLRPGGGLTATARVGDGRFRPFSVAFTVSRLGGQWLVSAASLPD